MTKENIIELIKNTIANQDGNVVLISADGTDRRMRIYDEPLVGFSDASDPLYEKYKEEGVPCESCNPKG